MWQDCQKWGINNMEEERNVDELSFENEVEGVCENGDC